MFMFKSRKVFRSQLQRLEIGTDHPVLQYRKCFACLEVFNQKIRFGSVGKSMCSISCNQLKIILWWDIVWKVKPQPSVTVSEVRILVRHFRLAVERDNGKDRLSVVFLFRLSYSFVIRLSCSVVLLSGCHIVRFSWLFSLFSRCHIFINIVLFFSCTVVWLSCIMLLYFSVALLFGCLIF